MDQCGWMDGWMDGPVELDRLERAVDEYEQCKLALWTRPYGEEGGVRSGKKEPRKQPEPSGTDDDDDGLHR